MTCPLLSICIPTYNRASLLDYCLSHLHGFERFGLPFEVVVSDNASPDDTSGIVQSHMRAIPSLRYFVQPKVIHNGSNYFNAVRHARGKIVVYLADDDSFIPEVLIEYVRRLEREDDLAAIYTDWIAYDDAQGRELHRYFQFSEPVCFSSDTPLALLEFLLQRVVLPEVGVFRREALLQAECYGARGGYPAFHVTYRLSRWGRVAFELLPFYREHRVLKPSFQSRCSINMERRLHLIGDEFRNHLETVALWAFQDAGASVLDDEQKGNVRALIDRFLEARLPLEIRRSIQEKNWLLAAELRRRMVLWNGPGTPDDQRRDILDIVLPAALQSIHATYCSLSDVSGLCPLGFCSRGVHDFFRQHYPEVKLLDPKTCRTGAEDGHPLLLFRDDQAVGDSAFGNTPSERSLRLSHLMNAYRISTATANLSTL